MRFSILGTIEVRQDSHVVRLSGAMQQTLLAALLVSDGTLLTVDALMEELWGTTPPTKVDNALHAQISRLRRSLARLEPDRTESRIATSASGYQIVIDRTELDAWTFVDAVDSGGWPGTVSRFDASDEPLPARAFRSSTHAFGVGEAIELARAVLLAPALDLARHVVLAAAKIREPGGVFPRRSGRSLRSSTRWFR